MTTKYTAKDGEIIYDESYDSPIKYCYFCIHYGYRKINNADVVLLDDQSFSDSNCLRIRIRGVCLRHTKKYPITTRLVENTKEEVEKEIKNFQFKLIMES